jgi:hypothetical protein
MLLSFYMRKTVCDITYVYKERPDDGNRIPETSRREK